MNTVCPVCEYDNDPADDVDGTILCLGCDDFFNTTEGDYYD